MPIFQAKISRARFVISPFSASEMQEIGEIMARTIHDRIQSGQNVNDAPAKPLKAGRVVNGKQLRGYPDYKRARGLNPFRDWTWTGRTMRALKVKSADENKVTVGFTDPVADFRAHIQNRRERMFGVSPNDMKALHAAVKATLQRVKFVQFRKVA